MTTPRTVKRGYPVVPECYRGEANADPHKLIKATEQRAREDMVAVEQIKMMAEGVKECYRKEGVNHYRNCEEITRAYVKRVQRPTLKDGPVELSDVEN